MLALKLKNIKFVESTKQAEELAEVLERPLVIEGTTQAKARQMDTEKTIDMCRDNARSTFTNPKDALPKL